MENASIFDQTDVSFDDAPDGVGGAGDARHAAVLGNGKLNTLGDLHALQQMCDRQARRMRDVFEPLLRRQPKVVAEPLRVERFDDYLTRLPGGLVSLTMLDMNPLAGQAMVVLEASFALRMVDLYFGGTGGEALVPPAEFTPTEDAIIRRTVNGIVEKLTQSWSELAEVSFQFASTETNPRLLSHLDDGEPVIITRFDVSYAENRSSSIDIVYPLNALKPLASVLSAKVHNHKRGGVDPKWHGSLTRAVMNVAFPVRSVLCEPVVPLSRLMNLKPGDVIPIDLGPEIPLLVSSNRFALGTVGQANGKTAIRLDRIEQHDDEDRDQ